ncbi:protein translocase subunit SecD [Thiospirillum jenense]|uniref:Protein translocase subunit SecD n=1 Tax=Thiospirillum jenense TaxID=1653858 RepID=A0A839HP82_9GAMM|nr:protein translocase subunit SecD [Thiospirillum jenense]MBB1127062.1 protein translocase subunit SecD [Thiospirillum jenense]
MNRYPLWKNLVLLSAALIGLLLTLPNLFSQDPSIEISAMRGVTITDTSDDDITAAMERAAVPVKAIDSLEGNRLLLRLRTSVEQLRAQEVLQAHFSDRYNSALTLAPDLPRWVSALGMRPMFLGLDLRGGIHVLIDVDLEAAVKQALERYAGDARTELRSAKIRYVTILNDAKRIELRFADQAGRDAALEVMKRELRDLSTTTSDHDGNWFIQATLPPAQQQTVQRFALQQNITTLRNRVNALGVSEPIIQQQGERRIVVQLPGAQDPGRLKEILGATATLEYRLVDTEHSVQDAVAGRVPVGAALYKDRDGQPVLLKRRVIVTGDQITDAAAGFDQQSGSPAVFVSLDGPGARRMRNMTTENVGKPMAVVFIENRTMTRLVNGETIKERVRTEEVISVANILEPFGRRFQTTGLDSSEEAHTLALLLRAGALAAPIEIVEERTIGPSLGQDNIDQGLLSLLVGYLLVAVFMVLYYRVFGLVANAVLIFNVLLLVAVMSLLQATLTLPGIAGIVLTVGMAVDANVLIYERIREEIRNGSSPQASIHAGFDRALSSIVDANITTLIAAVVLFSFGAGPVKGFAVTLFIGILTTMFSAIYGSRALINLIYGGRRVQQLTI